MSPAATLGALLLMQASLSDGLLQHHVLASLNQCRALHAELRVLKLSEFRSVDEAASAERKRWRALDESGREFATVERRQVAVNAGATLGDPARLLGLREALSAWSPPGVMTARVKDRRGNVFAWTGQLDGGLVCVVYRPEKDELERTWIATSALEAAAQLRKRGV